MTKTIVLFISLIFVLFINGQNSIINQVNDIENIPYLALYKNNQIIFNHSGLATRRELENGFKNHL